MAPPSTTIISNAPTTTPPPTRTPAPAAVPVPMPMPTPTPSGVKPASGTVAYQNMRVDNPFKGDTWLRAIAIKPGARTVLHHVTSNHSPDRGAAAAKIPGGSVGSYTPGAEPQIIADGAGAPVPAGGKLSFSMHYTTTGKATTDQTQIGYYTLKSPPEFIKRSTVISDFALKIPKGEARHKEIAYLEFPADAYIYRFLGVANFVPMQRSGEAWVFPDGTSVWPGAAPAITAANVPPISASPAASATPPSCPPSWSSSTGRSCRGSGSAATASAGRPCW